MPTRGPHKAIGLYAHVTWHTLFPIARGFCAGSLSRSHIRATRVYLASQQLRHADRIPT